MRSLQFTMRQAAGYWPVEFNFSASRLGGAIACWACIMALVAACLLAAPVLGADPALAAAETALPPVPAADKDTPLQPLVLKIAVNDIYCTKTACSCLSEIATRSYDNLLAELKDKHHITLEFTYFMEVLDLQNAVTGGKYDGFLSKPWSVLHLASHQDTDYKRVADLCDPCDHLSLSGVFLALADSPLHTLADVQGKRIALGQPDAYEKNQAPLAMLAAKGIQPAAQLLYSSCGENISALLDGKVDVAVVSSYALTATCAVDFAKPEQFRTLAATAKMPLTSLLLDMRQVSLTDAARVQRALLDLSGAKVPKDLTGMGFVLPVSWKPLKP